MTDDEPDILLDKPKRAPDWVPSVDDEKSISRLWWLLGLVLVAGGLVFLVQGANRPSDPALPARVALPGFGEVAVTVKTTAGEALERCLLLAATEEQHQRGLMEVTDPALGGYDGMLFAFEADSTAQFYMRNTPMPLSIAFVDGRGAFVSTADMAPCADVDGCPLYPAAGPYRYAVEVPQGRLSRLGLEPGATMTVGDPACPPE